MKEKYSNFEQIVFRIWDKKTPEACLLTASGVPNFNHILLYYFDFLPTIFVFITYQSDPATQTEEYVPQTTPTINGSANSLIDVTPRI